MRDDLNNDEKQTAMLYTIMLDDMVGRGISWGCAGAIAGVGISIAGLFIGGPVTVAAAALWGAGHVLSVLSLTACGGRDKNVFQELIPELEDRSGALTNTENLERVFEEYNNQWGLD